MMYIQEIIARGKPSNYIMEAIGDLYAMIRRLVGDDEGKKSDSWHGGSISVRYLSPYHSFRVSLRADADLFPAVTRRALRCIFPLPPSSLFLIIPPLSNAIHAARRCCNIGNSLCSDDA